ncbi:serine/threonine protein kinase [Micromonospora fiedleri]|uniref:non-specific serine/threonine protein kinase n=1 Tax=Micromonospora fiedleri TaxID=1157498 RepID=A0ABS1UME6_9ACTN|nr:serine/threonine-protein kinase [Micromonospora fiedleri]MBL6277516.1 serine/threonine protein kinase [Micromonospora fiedleri]
MQPTRIGSYRIERLLGVGSFATVWLGYDESLDARVAIKVLAENWSHDLRVRERFRQEARLLWRLDHERLVSVHAVGELDDGRPYAVLAWADGGSLRDRLADGPLPAAQSVRLLREVAAGVAVLHDSDVVHRDITPGNVLFRTRATGEEQVLIADLGLAKALAAASGLTARAGTPGYMAPEQDDPLAIVDARADVYGLGRLGVTLLAVPQDGQPPSTTFRLRPEVSAAVAAVLRTATAAVPADRYPDAAAFGAALDTALVVSSEVAEPGVPTPPRRRRLAMVSATAAVAGLTLAGTIGGAAWAWSQRGPQTGTDQSGQVSVTLPDGWRVTGSGWSGQRNANGGLEPAMLISPDPDRWASDPGVPGAFVGASAQLAARTTPRRLVTGREHAQCVASGVRTTRQAGIDWMVASFTGCSSGKPEVIEAAGLTPDGGRLVYVQVAPPAGGGTSFVDSLLAGVRVSG